MHQQRMERVQVHTPRSPVAAAMPPPRRRRRLRALLRSNNNSRPSTPSKATAKHRPRPASLRRTRDQRNWREFVLTAVSSQVQR
ncbi:unnamed protein product [Acanthoscelides obtectus]|uniref:Uncharacterized protein n=1 Tax=Acanthoscelides obtectus TaxID=200917 RepID=A0A9P0K2P4_ACAOB|nr:unnamed protein product [Acanthoscelides obtectus]CAK1656988.1 hypothetical protein AOBTE_LOCUS20062 [Acanthoscelides obtectus]